jgi:Protein of unknown function (DUF2442)
MTTSAAARQVRAADARVGRDYLEVVLTDGRTIRAPIGWFPRLAAASQAQRRNWRLIGRGIGIRWDAVDEDISVEQLLRT